MKGGVAGRVRVSGKPLVPGLLLCISMLNLSRAKAAAAAATEPWHSTAGVDRGQALLASTRFSPQQGKACFGSRLDVCLQVSGVLHNRYSEACMSWEWVLAVSGN